MVDKLRSFCIQNNYFTRGTNEQYQEFFNIAESGVNNHILAEVIWTYSDNDDLETIEAKLNNIRSTEEAPYIMIDIYSEQPDDYGYYNVIGQRKEYV